MPVCYICNSSFSKVNALFTHMSIIHHRQTCDTYYCKENNCTRNFPNQKSFRKHLKSHEPQNYCSTENNNNLDKRQPSLFADQTVESCPSKITPIANLKVDFQNRDPRTVDFLKGFKVTLLNNSVSFITKLYAQNSSCRKDIQIAIANVTLLLNDPMNVFKKFLLNEICEKYSISHEDQFKINCFFNEFNDCFQGLATEHLRFKYLQKSNLYISPQPLILGQCFERSKGSVTPKNYTAHYIPIDSVLIQFFNLPNVLSLTVEYLEKLKKNHDKVYNIVQTAFWKKKICAFHENDVILPLFLYNDDVEIGNPLGSHAGIHKIGVIYYTVACLPPSFKSQLDNIFIALLYHASDIKRFGEKIVFSKLIRELNVLQQHGIILGLEGKKIYFRVVGIIGDNLALNSLLGFQPSFSANSFCRFCRCLRAETQTACGSNFYSLRDISNYNEDLATNNPFSTGIKFNSSFNDLNFFHVTENYCVDVAHDIFEGVAPVLLGSILNQFILNDKLFTLETLNNKIEYFNINDNKPPGITQEQLKKFFLKMSASEMKTFLLNAGLILGDLIPEGNQFWFLYLKLRKILRIILCEYTDNVSIAKLKELVLNFNSLYIDLFKTTLRPKFHNLFHYADILNVIGPILQTSTLRYESKHRVLKQSANVVASRVNITLTMAIKHQLKLTARFANREGFKLSVNYSKHPIMDVLSIVPNFQNLIKKSKFKDIEGKKISFNKVIPVKLVTIQSKLFRQNDIILIEDLSASSFKKIKFIFINELNEICFVCTHIEILSFHEHFFCYQVKPIEEESCYFFEELAVFDTFTTISRNNKTYLTY